MIEADRPDTEEPEPVDIAAVDLERAVKAGTAGRLAGVIADRDPFTNRNVVYVDADDRVSVDVVVYRDSGKATENLGLGVVPGLYADLIARYG